MNNTKKKPPDGMPVQMIVDPSTGRNITGEVISQRLKELEILAEELIKDAIEEVKNNIDKKKEIYEKYHREIHHKLGDGSIGPATAAAGPLMYKKMAKLAKKLEIKEQDRLH